MPLKGSTAGGRPAKEVVVGYRAPWMHLSVLTTAALAVLKAVGVIDTSWLWILAPVWIPVVVIFVLPVLFYIGMFHVKVK